VQLLYGLPETALIDMGDCVGGTLKYLRRHPVPRVSLAGGFAKLAKLATGHLDLHSSRSAVDVPVLAAWLADQGWPVRTYAGRSLDDPGRQVFVDAGGPGGLHAMVRGPGDDYFVDPYWQDDRRLYASYFRRDFRARGRQFSCGVDASSRPAGGGGATGGAPLTSAALLTAGNLRTYRAAVAATVEYTAFHGGTVPAGLAAVVTAMTRVSGIYTQEASIAFQLVPNNNLIIYASNPDPYNNNNLGSMLSQNQSNLDSVIGSANYDVGHVFATSSGGIAYLGVVCNASFKAAGVTGLSSPIGDPFYVDYVAHEMGHQADAEHTWNGALGSCGASQHNPSTAMEPGSGSTIMGYAGICSSDNLQSNSDANFHAVSLNEILAYANGSGACASTTFVNPNAPTVTAPADVTIPMDTPFELTATNGNDADGHTLSYSWEQYDPGTRATLASGDDGVQPIFRAWAPTASPTRTFPRLSNLLANTTPVGETLPVTNRSLDFRIVARDGFAGGGRIATDDVTLTVTTTSGPFEVTSPNGGESFAGGPLTVTWDAAGTTGAPVSAADVDILLSTDGGSTFPIALATATPNDGSEVVALPPFLGSDSARVKVKGSGNVFFDVSNGDFSFGPQIPALSRPGRVALALGIAALGALVVRGRRRRVF